MRILPLFLAGAAVVLSLSPDASSFIGQKLMSMVPQEIRTNAAASWVDGHQSIALMYLSMALFFVTRTVSRLVDR